VTVNDYLLGFLSVLFSVRFLLMCMKQVFQAAGQSRIIQICNKSFKTVEQFKYLRTTPTNQNFIRK
jgi:hypothetical protein